MESYNFRRNQAPGSFLEGIQVHNLNFDKI